MHKYLIYSTMYARWLHASYSRHFNLHSNRFWVRASTEQQKPQSVEANGVSMRWKHVYDNRSETSERKTSKKNCFTHRIEWHAATKTSYHSNTRPAVICINTINKLIVSCSGPRCNFSRKISFLVASRATLQQAKSSTRYECEAYQFMYSLVEAIEKCERE